MLLHSVLSYNIKRTLILRIFDAVNKSYTLVMFFYLQMYGR